MDTFNLSMAGHFRQVLEQRAAELRHILHSETSEAAAATSGEVTDFKEAASEESLAIVEEAHAAHAAQELEQVLAALHRLDDHHYGHCLDCGEPIDLRRLTAIPSTPFCTACQSIREQARESPARG